MKTPNPHINLPHPAGSHTNLTHGTNILYLKYKEISLSYNIKALKSGARII